MLPSTSPASLLMTPKPGMKKIDRNDRSRPPKTGTQVVTDVPDYYNLLELQRSGTLNEISEAYRYFAKKWHPVNHKHADAHTREHAKKMFNMCNEAYETLGNAKSRAVYDFYGGIAARNGIIHETVDHREGSFNKEFRDDPEEYFRKQTYNHSVLPKLLKDTTELNALLVSLDKNLEIIKLLPQVSELCITLEELYNGCVKTVPTKPVPGAENTEEHLLEVKIVPGITQGTRLQCPRLKSGPADRCVQEPPDLLFEVTLEPHPRFQAEAHDLYTIIRITLAEVMGEGPINLEHLDGRIVPISLTELASPNVARIIKGEGLPKDEYRKDFGDLYVNFDIIFPDEIDPWQKLELWVAMVEYPHPRPPVHYAIAPISETSPRTAKKLSMELPQSEPENAPENPEPAPADSSSS